MFVDALCDCIMGTLQVQSLSTFVGMCEGCRHILVCTYRHKLWS